MGGANITITNSHDFANEGVIQASNVLSVTANNSFKNLGSLIGNSQLHLNGQSNVVNEGTMSGGLLSFVGATSYFGQVGSKLNAADLNLTLLGDFTNFGSIIANTINLDVNALSNNAGGAIQAQSVTIKGWDGISNAGTLAAADKIDLKSYETIQNSGSIMAGYTTPVGATYPGSIWINSDDKFTNSGQVLATGTVHVTQAPDMNNTATGVIQGRNVDLSTIEIINKGKIIASDQLKIDPLRLTNVGSAGSVATLSGQTVIIDVDQDVATTKITLVNGTYGLIKANDATIRGATVNDGFLSSKGISSGRLEIYNDLNVTLTKGDYTFDEELSVGGNFTFKIKGNITNNSTISAGNNLTLTSTSGSIANGSSSSSSSSTSGGGKIYAGKDLTLNAANGNISNYGSVIQADGNVTIKTGGEVLNTWIASGSRGRIQAEGNVTVTADGKIENIGSIMSASANMTLTSQVSILNKTVDTRVGLMAAGGLLKRTAPVITDSGTVQAGTLTDVGDTIEYSGGPVSSDPPDAKIDLDSKLKLVGAKPHKGTAPAYKAVKDSDSSNADTKAGGKLGGTVDAKGKTGKVKDAGKLEEAELSQAARSLRV